MSDVPVLIVDDQAPFRRAARAVVERVDGFVVAAEALSGEEAVDLPGDPELVLMDINLGGMTGIEAAKAITTARPGVVVFLLSTYAAADLPPEAHTCGAAAYVNKEDLTPKLLRRLWDERAS